MVKRSRDQSQEAPSRFSWLTMVPPDSAFQAQTFSRNSSRPMRAAVGLLRSISWRSTTIWVAMPAWSVPGCQSTSLPRMRSKRQSTSCSVLLSAWPICSEPSGGEKYGRPARKAPASSHMA